MKKLLLLVLVAISTTGYSQNTSNVKIKSSSCRTYQFVEYETIDSTWTVYDSLTLEINALSAKYWDYEDTTTGFFMYDFKEKDQLIAFDEKKQSFDFNFETSKLTRTINNKTSVETILYAYLMPPSGVDADPLDEEYIVSIVTDDGYSITYYVNFNRKTLEYRMQSNLGSLTRRLNIDEFKPY